MTHEVWCGAESRSAPRQAPPSSPCPQHSLPLHSVTSLQTSRAPGAPTAASLVLSVRERWWTQGAIPCLRLVGSCRESLGRGDAEEGQLGGSRTAHAPIFTIYGGEDLAAQTVPNLINSVVRKTCQGTLKHHPQLSGAVSLTCSAHTLTPGQFVIPFPRHIRVVPSFWG